MNLKLVLTLMLLLSLCLCFFGSVSAQVDPLILFDDWFASGWTNDWSWGLGNDMDDKVEGVTSLFVDVPASAQYQNLDYTLAGTIDLTIYNNFFYWFKGNNSGEQLQFRFANNASSFYYASFDDSYEGWNYNGWLGFKTVWLSSGTPDWSKIGYFVVMMSSDNANPVSVKFDYLFVTNGTDISLPTPTPTASPAPIEFDFEEYLFGDLAIFGILVFIILGLVAIKLSRFSGVFVGLIGLLYEFMLFDGLDIYGNNIWYMVIVLFYSIFAFIAVFDKF